MAKARKKKRISKHILQSRTTGEPLNKSTPSTPPDGETPELAQPRTNAAGKKRGGKKNTKEKNMDEVLAYLSAWKYRDLESGNVWKFKTNTQSWLLRHMYDPSKLSKSTFALMIDYIGEIKSEKIIKRILKDANDRALCYKEWERKEKGDSTDDKEEETEKKSAIVENNDDKDKKQESSDGVVAIPPSKVNGDNGELRASGAWDSMDDHDKRKAYKRARQVIDVLRKRVEIEKT